MNPQILRKIMAKKDYAILPHVHLTITEKLGDFIPAYCQPSDYCITGRKLRKRASKNGKIHVPYICAWCYGFSGRQAFRAVKEKQYSNLLLYLEKPELWESDLISKIRRANLAFFRFFSTGDFWNYQQLEAINRIALALPFVRFWTPTLELSFLTRFLDNGNRFASNLNIRLSSPLVNVKRNLGKRLANAGVTQTVVRYSDDFLLAKAFPCSHDYDNSKSHCMDCLKCWDRDCKLVSYTLKASGKLSPKKYRYLFV